MADVTIKSIGIDVKANCENAIKSLNRLKSTIESLSKLGSNSGFQTLCDKLTMIASLDFSKAESNLSKIATSLKEVGKSKASVNNITNAISRLADKSNEASKGIQELREASKGIWGMGESLNKNKPIQSIFDPRNLSRLNSGYRLEKPINSNLLPAIIDNQSMFERVNKRSRLNISRYNKKNDLTSMFGINRKNLISWLNGKNTFTSDSKNNSVGFRNFGGWKTSGWNFAGQTNSSNTKSNSNTKSSDGSFVPSIFKKTYWDVPYKDTTAFAKLRKMTQEWFNNYTATKKASDGMNYFLRTIKRFAIYKSLTVLIKGFNKSLQNLARYGKEANAVLSEYKSLGTYLGNSLASAVIPWLQLLLPLATKLTNVIVDLANAFNILGAAINGNSTYTKAKKMKEDFAESLEGQGKTTGFDQINQLSKTEDYESMFETVTIEAKDVMGAITKSILAIQVAIAAITITHLPSIIMSATTIVKVSTTISEVWTTVASAVGTTAAGLATGVAVIAAFAIWGDKISAFTSNFRDWWENLFVNIRSGIEWFEINLPGLGTLIAMPFKFCLTIIEDLVDWIAQFVEISGAMFYDLFHGNLKGLGVDTLNFFIYVFQCIADMISWVVNAIIDAVNGCIDVAWNNGLGKMLETITGKDYTFKIGHVDWDIPTLTLNEEGKMTWDTGSDVSSLLEEQNKLLKENLGKSSTVSVTTIENAASRNNRRLATVRD